MFQKATERLYNVLLFPDGGWLVDSCSIEEDSNGMNKDWEGDIGEEDIQVLKHLDPEIARKEPSRTHQLSTLRSIYIPQVKFFRIGTIFFVKSWFLLGCIFASKYFAFN